MTRLFSDKHLGDNVPESSPAAQLLPSDYRRLTGALPAVRSLRSKLSGANTGKTLMSLVMANQRTLLLRKAVQKEAKNPGATRHTISDACRTLTGTSRSQQAGRVTQANDAEKVNQMSPRDYVP